MNTYALKCGSFNKTFQAPAANNFWAVIQEAQRQFNLDIPVSPDELDISVGGIRKNLDDVPPTSDQGTIVVKFSRPPDGDLS